MGGEHVGYIVEAQKMDLHSKAYAGRCTKCDYKGGIASKEQAQRDADQHAAQKNAAAKA